MAQRRRRKTPGKEASKQRPAKKATKAASAKKASKAASAKKASKATSAKKASKAASAKKASRAARPQVFTSEDLARLSSNRGLYHVLKRKSKSPKKVLRLLEYEHELMQLQTELVMLQRDVQQKGRRVAILFEGRDAAGKGGSIRRFMEHLNPRSARVVALPKPTEVEQGQWYFQRYARTLPNRGEICFFDRSWYNRAVVEPVMGFCDKRQYRLFMQQVPEYEHMLYEDGIELIKFWFSISKDEQRERFDARRTNPLKQWKISPVDEQAQERWDLYTRYKEAMFSRTHTTFSPWVIIRANSKKRARLGSMRYVLTKMDYPKKGFSGADLQPDPDIVRRYHRSADQDD